MKRSEILDQATILTSTDREQQYGPWSDNAVRIAAGWSLITNHNIEPRHVALMMAWVKTVRLREDNHGDSWVDLAGYAALGGEFDG